MSGIKTVVLGGIATNFGVESTGRAADEHGYDTVYVIDAMTGLDGAAHDFAVSYVFPKFGKVCTGTEYVAALGHVGSSAATFRDLEAPVTENRR